MAKFPRVFNRLFTSMVKAGESGGLLAEILDRLASFLEASSRLRKKVKSALMYPTVVSVCASVSESMSNTLRTGKGRVSRAGELDERRLGGN